MLNEDAAHDCLSELGNLGAIQFTDVRADLCYAQRGTCSGAQSHLFVSNAGA